MISNAKYYIDELKLAAHPEGGYFKEVYRSDEVIVKDSLHERYDGRRVFSTSIYFLLEGNQFSSFHKLNSDETWHFYDGSPVKIFMIDEEGKLSDLILGRNIDEGERIQFTIPKNVWFAAEVLDKNSFCLVGCSVAPGFEFNDFHLAVREKMIKQFPQHANIIRKFTRT